ncbi:hypothetical protein B566_EDAN006325 [Ephemera danica]|nr:hypothetical protein B566_EDAN006325 [Ephemera danica]
MMCGIQCYRYNVFFMVLTYVLPICSMTYTYVRVGIELWGSQSIGECTQRQLENIRSKRRLLFLLKIVFVVKMMMVVVLIFVVCWLPFHVYFILTSHLPEITNWTYIQEVYLAIYWLAMSNSMYNPIIYCWMNSRTQKVDQIKHYFMLKKCNLFDMAYTKLTHRGNNFFETKGINIDRRHHSILIPMKNRSIT